MNGSPAHALALYYFLPVPNVGDLVGPAIAEALSGRRVVHARDLHLHPHLFACGSILPRATPESVIWGAGVMAADLGIGSPRAENILALRGKRSHAACRGAGLTLGDVPLGDPGVLAARLLGIKAARSPPHPIGFVPHYAERHLPHVARLLREDGVVDLNVHDEPATFLRNMARCGVVLSTSLHGLVFAESLGIPNLWLKASDLLRGGTLKFEDWFSTTRRPQLHPHLLEDRDTARGLAARAELHDLAIDQVALEAAFPSERTDILRPVPETLLPVEACRGRPMPVVLVSHDRGDSLRRAVASLRRQTVPVDIIVLDRGSSTPATLAVLGELESAGVAVVRRPDSGADGLFAEINAALRDYFACWAEGRSFAVGFDTTDLSALHPRSLEVYVEVLRRFPVFFAGPAGAAAGPSPLTDLDGFGPIALTTAAHECSFAVYRAGDVVRDDRPGMRTGGPFSIRGPAESGDDRDGFGRQTAATSR